MIAASEHILGTQYANVTHPCLGFALMQRQRSKHNTQNPPQNHQPTVQHGNLTKKNHLNKKNPLKKPIFTTRRLSSTKWHESSKEIRQKRCKNSAICVCLCVCVCPCLCVLPPDGVWQWGQLVVIYLECRQLLQHSYIQTQQQGTFVWFVKGKNTLSLYFFQVCVLYVSISFFCQCFTFTPWICTSTCFCWENMLFSLKLCWIEFWLDG